MRCRLILLISEHPIQQGIRKGGVRIFGHGEDGRRGRRGRTEWRILGSRICCFTRILVVLEEVECQRLASVFSGGNHCHHLADRDNDTVSHNSLQAGAAGGRDGFKVSTKPSTLHLCYTTITNHHTSHTVLLCTVHYKV